MSERRPSALEAPEHAMMPAYGGMFRPPLKRRWPRFLLGILAVILVLVGSGVLWLRHTRRLEALAATGTSCMGGYDCRGGLCIREDEEHPQAAGYCGNLCDDDKECPHGYICQPTRSQRRRACMIGARDP